MAGDHEKHDMAIDEAGRPLPYSSAEVRKIVRESLTDPNSELIAVILKHRGNLMVQVMGPPSQELVDILETTLRAYRTAARGH